jgi:hypothetical protein
VGFNLAHRVEDVIGIDQAARLCIRKQSNSAKLLILQDLARVVELSGKSAERVRSFRSVCASALLEMGLFMWRNSLVCRWNKTIEMDGIPCILEYACNSVLGLDGA